MIHFGNNYLLHVSSFNGVLMMCCLVLYGCHFPVKWRDSILQERLTLSAVSHRVLAFHPYNTSVL